MRILLVNTLNQRSGQPAGRFEISIDAHETLERPGSGIALVLIDARGMPRAMVDETLEWVTQLRRAQAVGRVAVLWPDPPIDAVVRSLRAGINDIIKEPLCATRLFRLVAGGTTSPAGRKALRALIASGRMLEMVGTSDDQNDLAQILQRERRIGQREAALAMETKRIEDLREVMQHREMELRQRATRLDEEFARMQMDGDVTPLSPAVASATTAELERAGQKRLLEMEATLRAREDALDKRSDELDARERTLEQFERMLRSQNPTSV